MPRYKTTEDVLRLANDRDRIRNIGIIAHVDHGKTTLSDSLLSASGLLSPSVAGEALALDYLKIEQERQFTYKAANVSLYYERANKEFLINLIDTPGHIDFTGFVTRSLRAIDGAVVVVDAVEEVMVQTETVTKQALEQMVRPVLFINKVDRLIKELRLTSKQIENKIVRITKDFNRLIETYGPEEFKNEWKIDPFKGSMAFGSAKDKWGVTLDIASKDGLKFSDIISTYEAGKKDELAKKYPVHTAILDMVTEHFLPPYMAQKYRVPKLWHGDIDSDVGKSMLACDPNGPVVMVASHMRVDPQAGVVATGRLFSGTVYSGQELYLINNKSKGRGQQVGIYMGPYREVVGKLPAGNIPALLGIEGARSGETITTVEGMVPFESIQYVSEPVMTVAVEPKHPRDLPPLLDTMKRLSIEDPNLRVTINEQTGEYLLSGMGQLHLEVALTFIKEAKLEVLTAQPVVIYRESTKGASQPVFVRSPNGHNKITIQVEPLENNVIKLIMDGKIYEFMDNKERAKLLRDSGWPADEARSLLSMSEGFNVFVDATKGVQRLEAVSGTMRIGFAEAMEEGVLAREPVRGMKVKLIDATIHEDPAHHGPGQIIPAIKRGIYAAMMLAGTVLLEPILRIDVRVSPDLVGNITRVLSSKRGKVQNIESKENLVYIVGELPASETFDLSAVIRSSTGGRAFWDTSFSRFDHVPQSIVGDVITSIRKRKGLPLELPKLQDFID